MQHTATVTAQARMAALTRQSPNAPTSDFRRLMTLKYSPRELEIAGIDDGGLLAALIEAKESQK